VQKEEQPKIRRKTEGTEEQEEIELKVNDFLAVSSTRPPD
jgi:hypothetical protein